MVQNNLTKKRVAGLSIYLKEPFVIAHKTGISLEENPMLFSIYS
jgi:hypothetical protein